MTKVTEDQLAGWTGPSSATEQDKQDRTERMTREAISTSQDNLLRPSEVAKFKCGKKHFAAIGIDDYAKSSPEGWNL